MTTQLGATQHQPGDPEADHTALLLVHRAMLTDAARFAVLLTDVAGAGSPIEAHRAAAARDYLTAFGTERREDVDLALLAEDYTSSPH